MPQRIDLDATRTPRRTPLDASWSPRRRTIVALAAAAASAVAIVAGASLLRQRTPLRLPRTAEEAVAALASQRFDRLDAVRQEAYLAEAARLLRQLDEQQRRDLLRGARNREALRRLMERRIDAAAKRFARGEDPFPGRRRSEEERQRLRERLQNRPERSAEELAQLRERFREQMDQRMAEQLATGNAQEGALRAEMAKRLSGAGRSGPGRGFFRRGGG